METIVLKPSSGKGRKTLVYLRKYWTLYLMLLLPLAYFVVFKYIPMTYIQIAFKKYSIIQSAWQMPWADNGGFEYFIKAFSNRDFLYALRNTIMLNVLDLVIGFAIPIILALLLNELAFKRLKRFTQATVYLPHFLSWIMIAGMALQLFAPTNGLVNIVLNRMGFASVPFLNDAAHWVISYVVLGIWQRAGWYTIIYLSALTTINPELYEAAAIDGAGRLKSIWHVTLPGIRPTIITLLIISLGYILGGDIDRPYSLLNPLVNNVGNVLSIFVFNYGIRGLQFSLATAVGLFQSVVGVMFVLAADKMAKRVGERGVW